MLDVTMLRKNLPEVVARLKTRNFDFPVDAFFFGVNVKKCAMAVRYFACLAANSCMHSTRTLTLSMGRAL